MGASLHYIGANGSTIDLFNNPHFYVSNADGLTDVSSAIAASTTPGMDGDKVNNIRTQPRGIVFDFTVKSGATVEDAKQFILQTIKPKQAGRLILETGGRTLEISGVVEKISMPRFKKNVVMQVTLHCSEPYWQDVADVLLEISRVLDVHCFPLDTDGLAFPVEGIVMGEYDLNMTRTYTNDGDTECGMVITIVAVGNVVNPTIYKANGSYIGVNDSMVVGDEIIINTNRGKKAITKNGVNILNKIKPGSTFIQLDTGDNELTIDSDGDTEGNVYFMLSFKRRFV